MAPIRLALFDIFTRGTDAWDAIWANLTANQIALSHSPVVVVSKKKNTSDTVARQLVYSSPREHPWGLLPTCGNPKCNAKIGNVFGNFSKNETWLSLACLQCKMHSPYIQRPSWIQPIPLRERYFVTPWPLTETHRREALGLDLEWSTPQERGEPSKKKLKAGRGQN